MRFPCMALGTGLILALLTIVAGAAFLGLSSAVGDFAKYRRLTRQTAAMGTIQADVLATRLGFRTFMVQQADESVRKVFGAAKDATNHGMATLDLFQSEERRQQITGVTELLEQYQAVFAQAVELQKQRNLPVR